MLAAVSLICWSVITSLRTYIYYICMCFEYIQVLVTALGLTIEHRSLHYTTVGLYSVQNIGYHLLHMRGGVFAELLCCTVGNSETDSSTLVS
jgi:hypothetical protein